MKLTISEAAPAILYTIYLDSEFFQCGGFGLASWVLHDPISGAVAAIRRLLRDKKTNWWL